MKEIKKLGVKETGFIDRRYGTSGTASYSLFECPVCLKQYEITTRRGKAQQTCKDCRGTLNRTHGFSHTPPYKVYASMKQRCDNPKNKKYPIYGGKGIKVVPAWDTFEKFWADMGDTYKPGLTIDREDSSKSYCKENCRWISLSQNSSETTKRKPVIQYRVVLKPIRSYEYIAEYESALQAATELGLVAAHITVVCQGKRKTHGGFAWAYK